MLFLWVKLGAAIFLLCHSQWFNPREREPGIKPLGQKAWDRNIGGLHVGLAGHQAILITLIVRVANVCVMSV